MKVKASQLKPDALVWVAGMLMTFSGFVGDNPVFYHLADPHICFHNRNWNGDTLIELA